MLFRSIFGHGKRNSNDYRRGGQEAESGFREVVLVRQSRRLFLGAFCDNAWEQDYPVLWRNRRSNHRAVCCIVNRETRKQWQKKPNVPLHAVMQEFEAKLNACDVPKKKKKRIEIEGRYHPETGSNDKIHTIDSTRLDSSKLICGTPPPGNC